MGNPTTGSGACAPRIRRSRSGWTWTARLALAVLACTFAGAGQAQDRSDNLDHAVNFIIRDIANTQTLGVQLREQSVFVGADDFFEEETEFDLRPRLSEMLRAMCRTALTRNGVGNLEMVESNAAWVLHGRWWRETRDSQAYLHLRLFIARPVEGDTPPRQVAGYARLVPIDGVIGNAIKPTLRHWGDSVVRQLESDLPGSGRYRLHIRPFDVQGAAQPGRLNRRLHNRWRPAFTGSRRFRLVHSSGFDGELFGEVVVTDERVEVDLYVQDTEGQQVAAAHVAPDKGLFPSGLFGPDVTAKLAECAGLVEAGHLGDAKGCYEDVRAGAPGEADAVEGVRAGLERIARMEEALAEEEAERGVRDAIGRGEFGEAKEGLERLRELNAGHPRLVELEGEIVRAEAKRKEKEREERLRAERERKAREEAARREREERKRADDAAYARAESEGTASAYAEYRKRYPEGRHAEEAERRERERTAGRRFRDCAECPELVVVPSGSYMMGSPSGESGRDDDEGPVHRVRIGRAFAVGVKEVMVGEYGRFVSETGRSMGDSCRTYEGGEWEWRSGRNWRNPGFSQTDEHPVVCVSHEDVQAYVEWLSGETGEGYRLLSESEWEYVARAGTGTARYWGESEVGQCRNANGADREAKRHNSGWTTVECDDGHYRTAPVGSFSPNGYGLRDVLGNVWEWVEDCWNESYEGAPVDGSAWKSGNCGRRVLRGGSWNDVPGYLRSANRLGSTSGSRNYFIGFRVARTFTP